MTTAEQWAQALGGREEEPFQLRFEELGLEAQCRPLTSGEVEECLRMGGERGMRYALYLSCKELREAGESLRKQGTVGSPFDITAGLNYGDVVAAGRAILQRSGTQGRVSARGGRVQQGQPVAFQLPEVAEMGGYPPESAIKVEEMPGESPSIAPKDDHWALADRLLAAWGNR